MNTEFQDTKKKAEELIEEINKTAGLAVEAILSVHKRASEWAQEVLAEIQSKADMVKNDNPLELIKQRAAYTHKRVFYVDSHGEVWATTQREFAPLEKAFNLFPESLFSRKKVELLAKHQTAVRLAWMLAEIANEGKKVDWNNHHQRKYSVRNPDSGCTEWREVNPGTPIFLNQSKAEQALEILKKHNLLNAYLFLEDE